VPYRPKKPLNTVNKAERREQPKAEHSNKKGIDNSPYRIGGHWGMRVNRPETESAKGHDHNDPYK
jgi:hypothetical protein